MFPKILIYLLIINVHYKKKNLSILISIIIRKIQLNVLDSIIGN